MIPAYLQVFLPAFACLAPVPYSPMARTLCSPYLTKYQICSALWILCTKSGLICPIANRTRKDRTQES